MKCTIPEISWHNREPVLSVHIQPLTDKFYRLATGGADCHVLIWQLFINENGAVKVEALSDLTRHQRAVNSVRWSPGGQYLATADDDANIIIWQLKTDNIPLLEGETNDKETWIVHKVLRGHKEDIYDVCWSPNGLKLLSGSIDNTAILWDLTKGNSEHILTDHKGFVQGVAWDPKAHYIATISTDRVCRIFDNTGKQVKARIQKGLLPVPEEHYLHNKDVKYFHDDTFKSFFRRLDFSPDGTLLAVPSGRVEIDECKKILNAVLVFAVDSWTTPIAVLPSGKQCSTVVRFCPILFELQEDGPEPIMSLPFRMVVAIGTDHDIILYDTQQQAPFAYFKDIHYTRLTDLTWSNDGLLLIASSTDGFCGLITFEPNELGVQYVKEESEAEESIMDISGCEELDKDENTEAAKPKRLSLLEKWTIKTPKKNKEETATPNVDNSNTDTNENDTEIGKRKREDDSDKKVVIPKRIKPILVANKTEANKTCTSQKVKKRIQPVPVEDKKPVKTSSSPKASPLLSFLKTASKEKTLNEFPKTDTNSKQIIDLTLDEIEARDSWHCEKDDKKCLANKSVDGEECTEDFSLHLDDTNSKTVNKENCQKSPAPESTKLNCEDKNQPPSIKDCVQTGEAHGNLSATNTLLNVEKKTNDSIDNKANVLKSAATELRTVTDEKHMKTTENGVLSKTEIKEGASKNVEHKETDKSKQSANPEEKVKRRIPLITLSSPKHKKK